jgi:aminopeptidase N
MRPSQTSRHAVAAAVVTLALLASSAGCSSTSRAGSVRGATHTSPTTPPSTTQTSGGSRTVEPGAGSTRHGQGIGDPYYPDDGNRGYDVAAYRVRLDYFRRTQEISATTTITSTATAKLGTVNFDLLGMHVTAATVDGAASRFHRAWAHELVVRPWRPIASGQRFVTTVTYHGKPGFDRVGEVPSGWYDATTPGAGFIAGEPHSCTLWYPCNDHPTDKATFSVAATVPRPFAVISNGHQNRTTPGLRDGVAVRTFRWRLREPTATYLTSIYIDKLRFERSTLPDGTHVVSAFGPHPGAAPRLESRLPEILRVLARRWGPYPAPAAGGIFVSGEVPFSLEVFTRPLYTEGANLTTIVHENGHQWWGDNVSVRRWRDICLNECLASYSQWLWDEHNGVDLDSRYRRGIRSGRAMLTAPLYAMGPRHEFDAPVYVKGPYFIHALRNTIGDAAFFAAMRRIQRTSAGGNLSMLVLRDRLERETGVDLTGFWDDWVLHARIPSHDNLHPGDL